SFLPAWPISNPSWQLRPLFGSLFKPELQLIAFRDDNASTIRLSFVLRLGDLAIGASFGSSEFLEVFGAGIFWADDQQQKVVAGHHISNALASDLGVSRNDLDADQAAAHLLCHHARSADADERIEHDLAQKILAGAEAVEPDQARRQLLRERCRMPAAPLHVLRIHEPNLLSEIEPFSSCQSVRRFHVRTKFGWLAGLHINVDEFNRVVFEDVAWRGVAPKHHLRGLLLPYKQAVARKVGRAQDALLDVRGDVLDVPRVLPDEFFRDRQDRRIDAQLA